MPKRGGNEQDPVPDNEVPRLNRLIQEVLGGVSLDAAFKDTKMPRKTKKAAQKYKVKKPISQREHNRLLGNTLSQQALSRLQAEREQKRHELADDPVDFFDGGETGQSF